MGGERTGGEKTGGEGRDRKGGEGKRKGRDGKGEGEERGGGRGREMAPLTQIPGSAPDYRSFQGRFYGSHDPTNSVTALKDDG